MKRSTLVAVAGSLALAACTDTPVDPALSTAPLASVAERPLSPGEDFVAGQVIVRFTPGAARSEIAEAHRARKKEDMLLERTEILLVPVGEELAIAAQLSRNPNVEFAEPDFIFRLAPCELSTSCNLPDGQFFGYKWDLHNTGTVAGQSGAKPDADIDWVEAHDYLGTSFAGSAVIGILDTGIRPTHQSFTGKILGGRRFVNDTFPVSNYIDDHSHGTHVASIAAGRRVAAAPGVAYGANIKLLIGKVCDAAGNCPVSAVANGIMWAADNGANVINLSLGGFGSAAGGSSAQLAALRHAVSKNVLPVCATGNDDNKADNGYTGGVGYPARFNECLAVGATNWSDTKASYSNWGPGIDVSAPGGDGNELKTGNSLILAAVHGGDGSYNWKAGTSMAAPQVAGLAALLYATGVKDVAAVRQRIISTVDDVETPGWDQRTGFGRINVYRAITGLDANAAPVVNPGTQYAGAKGVPVQFDGSASFDPNGKAVSFAWNFGDPTSTANSSTLATPTHTFLRAGSYTVTLTVTDAAGNGTTKTTVAVIPNIVPEIVALAGATLLQGETYATAGSFADADPDTWTASASYGDGSETEALPLTAAKSFALSHRYLAAGTQTVTVTVSDDDNGTGTASATVTVWTPQEGIQQTLLAVVRSLGTTEIASTEATVSADAMARGSFQALEATLHAAVASLDRGNGTTAVAQLRAFRQQVAALAQSGRISTSTAEALTARVDRVVASINR